MRLTSRTVGHADCGGEEEIVLRQEQVGRDGRRCGGGCGHLRDLDGLSVCLLREIRIEHLRTRTVREGWLAQSPKEAQGGEWTKRW